MPWVTGGLLGNLDVGNEAAPLTLTGSTRAGGPWGVGPWDVMAKYATGAAGPLLTPLGAACDRRTIETSIASPLPGADPPPGGSPVSDWSGGGVRAAPFRT
ncbi:hypothetical protein ACWGLB_20375 [Streptomyces sp. NPDC055893]